MDNKFNWDDEEEFRDIPSEINGTPSPRVFVNPAPPKVTEPIDEYEEVDFHEVDVPVQEDTVEDYSSVLADARLRLEQGRLYEMIMNHDIFGGVDADPRAMKNVQQQIRKFAKEQMEVMLGMRQTTGPGLSVDLPFNSLEVEAIKALASALTKGASEDPGVDKFVAPVEEVRSSGLNQIVRTQRKQEKRYPKKDERLPVRAKAPVKRVKVDPNLEIELREQGIERQYIEEAKRQLAQERSKPLTKDPSQMTPAELKERNREVANRLGTQVKSTTAMPMATPEQMEAIALSRASQAAAHPSMIKIMDLLNKQTNK